MGDKDIVFYETPTRPILVERFGEVAKYLTEHKLWNLVDKKLKVGEVERIILDSHLGNAIKEVMASQEGKTGLVTDVIMCGAPPPRPPKPVGNVRGSLKYKLHNEDPYKGVAQARILIKDDEHHSGKRRIVTFNQLSFSGDDTYFDVMVGLPNGRYSISDGKLMELVCLKLHLSSLKSAESPLFNVNGVDSLSKFMMWNEWGGQNRNGYFNKDVAEEMFPLEVAAKGLGLVANLDCSQDGNAPFYVMHKPIEVSYLSENLSYPLYFLGANTSDSALTSVEVIVLSQRSVDYKKGDLDNSFKRIESKVIDLPGIEVWATVFKGELTAGHAKKKLEFKYK